MSKPALWTKAYPRQVREGQRERRDREQQEYSRLSRHFKKAYPKCQACYLVRPTVFTQGTRCRNARFTLKSAKNRKKARPPAAPIT